MVLCIVCEVISMQRRAWCVFPVIRCKKLISCAAEARSWILPLPASEQPAGIGGLAVSSSAQLLIPITECAFFTHWTENMFVSVSEEVSHPKHEARLHFYFVWDVSLCEWAVRCPRRRVYISICVTKWWDRCWAPVTQYWPRIKLTVITW